MRKFYFIFILSIFSLSCTKTVKFKPHCGDGVANSVEEECDGVDVRSMNCTDFGYYEGGLLQCTFDCKFDFEHCEYIGKCGDDILQSDKGESCDGTQFIDGSTTCEDLGYTGGYLLCDDACTIDASHCSTCGNGILEPDGDEECDLNDIGENRCSDFGFWDGEIKCLQACMADSSYCNNLTLITIGNNYSCTVSASSKSYCWGDNTSGRLGTGDTSPRDTAAPVDATDLISLSAAWRHSCGIDSDNQIWCWGKNDKGQLGTGTQEDSGTPAKVSFLTPNILTMVSPGDKHTCALDSAGDAWCWGDRLDGKLGNNESTSGSYATPQPVIMTQALSFSSIASGKNHTCAINENNKLWCWGNNEKGSCGTGSLNTPFFNIPSPVSSDATFSFVASGDSYSCAIDAGGTTFCWGNNESHQLGTNLDIVESATPVRVDLPSGVELTMVSCSKSDSDQTGISHTCGLDAEGNAWCWGSGSSGQLGDSSIVTYSQTPVLVNKSSSTFFIAVSTGHDHSCALDSDGYIWCWGSNNNHQINSSDESQITIPTIVHSTF